MSRRRLGIFALILCMGVLVGGAAISYISPLTLRLGYWEIADNSTVPTGALVAKNVEVDLRNGRIAFLKTDWLTTPEMPEDYFSSLSKKNSISIKLRDPMAPPINPRTFARHFGGFGGGEFTLFLNAGLLASGMGGLLQINGGGLILPVWFFVMVVLVLIASNWLRKSTGHIDGFCRRCGYDLRATPERCPECGTRPEKILWIGK